MLMSLPVRWVILSWLGGSVLVWLINASVVSSADPPLGLSQIWELADYKLGWP